MLAQLGGFDGGPRTAGEPSPAGAGLGQVRPIKDPKLVRKT